MKVLILSPSGIGKHYHGPAISLFRLFKKIKADYHVDLHLLHGTPEQTGDILFSGVSDLGDFGQYRHGLSAFLGRLRFILHAVTWVIMHSRDFDVMIIPTTNALTLIPAFVAKKICKLPVIARMATSGDLREVVGWRRLLNWTSGRVFFLRELDLVVALSDEISQKLRALKVSPSSIIQVPNPADCSRFFPANKAKKKKARGRFCIPSDADFVVLCVGAIGPRKGQNLIAEAVFTSQENIHLLLVGPVRDERSFDDIQRCCQDARNVNFHYIGHMEDIEEAYFAADLFVLPSSTEGMPNAMVEAMACGLPVIGTPISGINDLIGDSVRGTIVTRSVQSIQTQILRYLHDSTLRHRHGLAGREYIISNQSDEVIALRWVRAIESIARNDEGVKLR